MHFLAMEVVRMNLKIVLAWEGKSPLVASASDGSVNKPPVVGCTLPGDDIEELGDKIAALSGNDASKLAAYLSYFYGLDSAGASPGDAIGI